MSPAELIETVVLANEYWPGQWRTVARYGACARLWGDLPAAWVRACLDELAHDPAPSVGEVRARTLALFGVDVRTADASDALAEAALLDALWSAS